MSRSTISGADGDDNAILHASLLSGSLSIKVIDTDIRRDVSHHLLHAARIETDYILQVDIGAQVDVHTKTRLCETLTRVVEMDEYFCSKRYDDVRQLAHSMRGNAEDVVKYYNAAAAAAAAAAVDIKQPKHTRGGSSLHGALLKKTAQAVRYIHNTECASPPMRMSDTLDQSSPAFVREILVGVDEFCEEIRSVKRQRGGRTKYSWSYVKSMSERRKATINRAFTLLIQALSRADLSSVSEERPGSIPVPLKSLIRSLETFLLTDVIVDLETEKTLFPQQNIEKSSSANTAPRPLTMRRRSSFVDRMAEERTLQEVAHDILLSEEIIGSSEKADDGGGAESSTRSTNTENWAIKVPTTEMRLLPCHPTDFGIIVAAGVVFFKAIEGRALNIQLDALVTFGFLCGLLGRQWTLHNIREGVAVALHQPTPKEMGRKPPEPPRPRPTMHKASGSINLSTQRAHRFRLIQKSLRHLGGILKDTETSVVPAKTFHKLPDGAAIGHHNNCWSSPPSEKFHVRGPTYLKDKAKVPSANYLFPCRGCDLFLTDNAPVNVGQNRSILGGKLRDVPTFIINYRLPWGIFGTFAGPSSLLCFPFDFNLGVLIFPSSFLSRNSGTIPPFPSSWEWLWRSQNTFAILGGYVSGRTGHVQLPPLGYRREEQSVETRSCGSGWTLGCKTCGWWKARDSWYEVADHLCVSASREGPC